MNPTPKPEDRVEYVIFPIAKAIPPEPDGYFPDFPKERLDKMFPSRLRQSRPLPPEAPPATQAVPPPEAEPQRTGEGAGTEPALP